MDPATIRAVYGTGNDHDILDLMADTSIQDDLMILEWAIRDRRTYLQAVISKIHPLHRMIRPIADLGLVRVAQRAIAEMSRQELAGAANYILESTETSARAQILGLLYEHGARNSYYCISSYCEPRFYMIIILHDLADPPSEWATLEDVPEQALWILLNQPIGWHRLPHLVTELRIYDAIIRAAMMAALPGSLVRYAMRAVWFN